MSLFENVEVPFKTIKGKKCLTMEQVKGDPWLQELVAAPHREGWFNYSPEHHVYFLIEKVNHKYA
jgi:hypothetical protein